MRRLQRAAGNSGVHWLVDSSAAPDPVSTDPGVPLDPAIRESMEAAFRQDLGDVRLHLDSEADRSARAAQADAFTIGTHMAFRSGRYAPETAAGRTLLAHELAHVIQQRGATRRAHPSVITAESSTLETAASQAGRAIASGQPAPAVGSAPIQTIQRSPASDLIGRHTTFNFLSERDLGADLARIAQRGEYSFIYEVLAELGTTDRDDVSTEMMEQIDDRALLKIASTEPGRRFLDRIFDELTSGKAGADEAKQADRIMAVKMKHISPAAFARSMEKPKVFPFRTVGITKFDSATMSARRLPGGKIWVKMPSHVLSKSMFREQTKTLPTAVFTSGIELPEDEMVGVLLYDQGMEMPIYRPALYLVQLANESITTTWESIGDTAGLALSFTGVGALGLAARSGWGARTLLWADRAATAIGVLAVLVKDHRGEIIRRFGEDGKTFLSYFDKVALAAQIYGIARLTVSFGQLVNEFRKSFTRWRERLRAVEADLPPAEKQATHQIEGEVESLLRNLDEGEKSKLPTDTPDTAGQPSAQPLANEKAVPTATPEPTGQTGQGGAPKPKPKDTSATTESTFAEISQELRDTPEAGGPVFGQKRGAAERKPAPAPTERPVTEAEAALMQKMAETRRREGLLALSDDPALVAAIESSTDVLPSGERLIDLAANSPEQMRRLWRQWQTKLAMGKTRTKSFFDYVRVYQREARGAAGEFGAAFGRGADEIMVKAPKQRVTESGTDYITYDPKADRIKLLDNKALGAGASVSKVSALEENLVPNLADDIAEVEAAIGKPGVPPQIETVVLPRLKAAHAELDTYLKSLKAGTDPKSAAVQQRFRVILDKYGIDRVVTTVAGGSGAKITPGLGQRGFTKE